MDQWECGRAVLDGRIHEMETYYGRVVLASRFRDGLTVRRPRLRRDRHRHFLHACVRPARPSLSAFEELFRVLRGAAVPSVSKQASYLDDMNA